MSQNVVLPHVLAAINGASVVCLSLGWLSVRSGARKTHRAAMIASVCLGVAFLVLYAAYHLNAGLAKFGGAGLIRPIYFGILIAHIAVAAAVAVLVPLSFIRALRGELARHRAYARWTMPAWLFVSVSGIVVYVMTIHLFPVGALS